MLGTSSVLIPLTVSRLLGGVGRRGRDSLEPRQSGRCGRQSGLGTALGCGASPQAVHRDELCHGRGDARVDRIVDIHPSALPVQHAPQPLLGRQCLGHRAGCHREPRGIDLGIQDRPSQPDRDARLGRRSGAGDGGAGRRDGMARRASGVPCIVLPDCGDRRCGDDLGCPLGSTNQSAVHRAAVFAGSYSRWGTSSSRRRDSRRFTCTIACVPGAFSSRFGSPQGFRTGTKRFFGSTFLAFLGLGLFAIPLTPMLSERFGLPSSIVFLYYTLQHVAIVLAYPLAARRIKRRGNRSVQFGGLVRPPGFVCLLLDLLGVGRGDAATVGPHHCLLHLRHHMVVLPAVRRGIDLKAREAGESRNGPRTLQCACRRRMDGRRTHRGLSRRGVGVRREYGGRGGNAGLEFGGSPVRPGTDGRGERGPVRSRRLGGRPATARRERKREAIAR